MSEELKPCPFCGGEPVYQAYRIAEDAMVAFVNCLICGVQTEHFEDAYAPRAEAIAAWNTRAPDPRIAEIEAEVERLRTALAALRKDQQ